MSTETVRALETYAALVCSRLVSLRFCHSLFFLRIRNYRVGVASSGMTTGQLFARTTHRESKQAITDRMTQRYGYTAVPNMQLQCPLRGRGRAVSTDPASCCFITVYTICIMGTSQVFTNKYTFFFKILKHLLRQETRFVSKMFRVQTSITHRLSSFHSANAGAVSLIRPGLLASSIFLI